MTEPPPRTPPEPPEDETLIAEEWAVRPEGAVVVEQTEETAPRRRMPVIWPWLLALLLAVLGGLGAYWYFTQEDETTVPAVIGMRQERAEATVRNAELDPVVSREASAKPRGIVLGQNPDPGTEVDEGETVPDVVGEPEREAVADLTAAGFEADVTKEFSDKKSGLVVAQDPKGGTNLKEGSAVALTVSKGKRPVTVPDVVGTTSSQATATLRQAGLQVNVVGVPSEEPSGTVVAQDPVAGKQAKSGDTVRLNVAQAPGETSTGPAATTAPPPATTAPPPTTTAPPPARRATVPEAVGKELAVAGQEFADAGLKVAVQYVPSNEPAGRVIAQAQPAGTERRRGDTVQLNVSIGAEPAAATSVPDVVGRRQDQARRDLERAGFEVLALNLDGEVRNESRVASQTPSAGASIPRGSLVILYVGS